MIISIVNRSDRSDSEVRKVVRAINRQIERDFEPHWDLGATLRLAARVPKVSARERDRRAVIHLANHGLDYHQPNDADVASGWVFTKVAEDVEAETPWLHWTVALSHETLELLADPDLNTLIKGPHPSNRRREVFHYREVCDPVQADIYEIGGVPVSNFVLPHYYNGEGRVGGENDFLRRGIKAFRWRRHGEIGFWDPGVGARGKYVTFPKYSPDDLPARVKRVKGKTGRLRRYARRRSASR